MDLMYYEDTWKPQQPKVRIRDIIFRGKMRDIHTLQDGPWSGSMPVSHGNYFYYAYKEGLLAPNNSNIVIQSLLLLGHQSHDDHGSMLGFVAPSRVGRTTKMTMKWALLFLMPKTSKKSDGKE